MKSIKPIKSMPQGIINFNNVFYSYLQPSAGLWALENINLSIAEGEFFAVMGETGSGKTTFCNHINGIIPHFCGGRLLGAVTVAGGLTTETSVPQLACKVGTVFDDPDSQLFTFSVRNEAAFGPENLMLPPQEIEERVNAALSAVGLAGFEERSPSSLSGGEKQRLAIAAAFAMQPQILVLDEPLSRLDPDGKNEVLSVIRNIREKYQLTVIMATHDSQMAYEYADRVCILKKGITAACGTAKDILSDPALLEENGIQPPGSFINKPYNAARCFNMHTHQIDGFHKVMNSPETSCEVSCNEAVRVKNLSFSYPGGTSIENINLSVKDNGFVSIIGRNGCGKTTLLKNIAGLLRPSAGEIFIRGKNTGRMAVSDISREAGFVMQNPDNQLFTGTVYNEVSYALKNYNIPKTEIKQRVEEALCAAGLENPDAFPHALNRADRTRTVIACILAMGCKIIILDEADVGQDYRGIINIMDTARKLHTKGYTIIFVTHNMSLACDYAETIVMMDKKGMVTIYEK